MNRREFIGGIGAFAGLGALGAAKERPYLKVGFLTDTHVLRTRKSCELVRGAFRVFREQGVEAIGHCGDLADLHYDEAYRLYRETVETTYPDKATRPRLLYVFAVHDLFDGDGWNPNVLPTPRTLPTDRGFRMMAEKLGTDQDWKFCETKLKGVPFLVFPQDYQHAGGEAFMREKVAAACKANPTMPVVVMTHCPPRGTTIGNASASDEGIRRVLEEFPQVVNFHGHSHGSLWDESFIWQGSFTAVNLGCLQKWFGRGVGVPFEGKHAYGAMVAEFYGARIVLRRFDVRDGNEYKPFDPWCVPLPFSAKAAPYSRVAARARERRVSYPKGAELKVVPWEKDGEGYSVLVPDSLREDLVRYHRLRIAHERDGAWDEILMQERFSEFYMREGERAGAVRFDLSAGYFDQPGRYRLTAVPVGFAGTEGHEISLVWTLPKLSRTETIWEMKDSMRELTSPSVKIQDGWFAVPDRTKFRVELPLTVWKVPKGSRIRFTADFELEPRTDEMGWKFRLDPQDDNWRHSPTQLVYLPPGKVKSVRVTQDFVPDCSGCTYKLYFSCPHAGRIRVKRMRTEKLSDWKGQN